MSNVFLTAGQGKKCETVDLMDAVGRRAAQAPFTLQGSKVGDSDVSPSPVPGLLCDYRGRSLCFPETPSTSLSVKWDRNTSVPGLLRLPGGGQRRQGSGRPVAILTTTSSGLPGLQAQGQHPSLSHYRSPHHHAPGDAGEGQHICAQGESPRWPHRSSGHPQPPPSWAAQSEATAGGDPWLGWGILGPYTDAKHLART